MSAGILAEKTVVGSPAPPFAGRTTLTGTALHRVALGIVRDAARVPGRDVSVSLSDDAGRLRAAVMVPVSLGARRGDSLIARGTALREAVVRGMAAFAERDVSAVDIRFSGVREVPERRVS